MVNIPFSQKLVLNHIKAIAVSYPCEEMGGVILNDDTPITIGNCSSNPEDSYIPQPEMYFHLMNQIKCNWHSHTAIGLNRFSPRDINSMFQSNKPMLLYCAGDDSFHYRDPLAHIPYLNRSWEQIWNDCYRLIYDFYRVELKVKLAIPHHTGIDEPWRNPEWNPFLEQLPIYFDLVELSDARSYDLALACPLRADQNPSHIGMLLKTNRGLMLLHHCYNKQSELTDKFNPNHVHSFWRLKGCIRSNLSYMANWEIDSEMNLICKE
jgi:hypothetical protein